MENFIILLTWFHSHFLLCLLLSHVCYFISEICDSLPVVIKNVYPINFMKHIEHVCICFCAFEYIYPSIKISVSMTEDSPSPSLHLCSNRHSLLGVILNLKSQFLLISEDWAYNIAESVIISE